MAGHGVDAVERAVVVNLDGHLQESFVLTAPHGQIGMRAYAVERGGEVEIIGVVGSLVLFPFHHLAFYGGIAGILTPYAVAHGLVLVDPFGNYVGCPLQGGVSVSHIVRDESCGSFRQAF